MAIYSFGYFSQAFPIVFSGPLPSAAAQAVFPNPRKSSVGIVRFANRRPWDLSRNDAANSSYGAKTNGVVIITQKHNDSFSTSGVIIGRHGSMSIYGKTPSSVLATERKNTDAFGNVIYP